MTKGIPGLTGTDHIGCTVPDIDAASAFFVEVLGCEVLFDVGPFRADDDWMARHLNVHPRAEIRKLRMLKCAHGPLLELFEYRAPDQAGQPPRNSDVGAAHLAFYVRDMAAAVQHLHDHGVAVQGAPTTITDGPTAGLSWVYFLTPWGMQLELVSYPDGLAFARAYDGTLWDPAHPPS